MRTAALRARRLRPALCAGLLLPMLWAGNVAAHEVVETLRQVQATQMTLHYADGTPFAGEAFELRGADQSAPVQRGRTDAQGRALFVLDGTGPWRFRSFSDDGHGVERVIGAEVRGVSAPALPTAALETAGPGRSGRIVFGLGIVLALFGLLQLWLRRRGAR